MEQIADKQTGSILRNMMRQIEYDQIKVKNEKDSLFNDTFSKLDKIIDKQTGMKHSSNWEYNGLEFFDSQNVVYNITIDMYEQNGVKIFREKHSKTVTTYEKLTPEHLLQGKLIDSNGKRGHVARESNVDFYFLMDEGKMVTDERRAIEIIKENTGEKLPYLSSSKRSLDMADKKEVVIDLSQYSNKLNKSEESYLYPNELQPSDSDIRDGLEETVKKINSFPSKIDSMKKSLQQELGVKDFNDISYARNILSNAAKEIKIKNNII